MNETQIRYAYEIFKNNSELTEIRVIGQWTQSGYFTSVDKIISEIKRYQGSNIYFTLNTISDACYSREQRDRIIERPKNTTSDNDVIRRNWLLIDIDSKRATGVSATDAEKEESFIVGRKVYKYLRSLGFSDPISADSGNGLHLLYKIDLPNDKYSKELIQNCLETLHYYFSTPTADVDKSVSNASRITKLYGTIAVKGQNTPERPHRVSKILNVPKDIKVNSIELLTRLSDQRPKKEEPKVTNNYGRDEFDIDNFLSKHSIRVTKRERYKDGEKYILEHCIFDESHRGKDAVIFRLGNGAIGYKCFHNSCADYKWQDVRRKFEPTAYDRPSDFRDIVPQKRVLVKKRPTPTFIDSPQPNGKTFLQMDEIEAVDRNKIISIPSRFKELDKHIVGFNLGEVSLWSGKNASGKSIILNQLCLNACQGGYKPLIFSGELTSNRMKQWIQLQAAGRQFVQPTHYDNVFYVDKREGKKIDEWLKGKLYIYNNDFGNDYLEVLENVKKQIVKVDADMVVLDNIMALDIGSLSPDKWEQQKLVVQSLSALAKQYNVHIHIVAHPRKAVGFLRKDDISGTADLSNIVDNVLIVHRVNNDFQRMAKEFFGEREASKFYIFDNVIEICKNRDLGVMDEMVGLYFEVESKRLLNTQYENIIYDWMDETVAQALPPQTTIIEVEEGFYKERDLPKGGLPTDLPF